VVAVSLVCPAGPGQPDRPGTAGPIRERERFVCCAAGGGWRQCAVRRAAWGVRRAGRAARRACGLCGARGVRGVRRTRRWLACGVRVYAARGARLGFRASRRAHRRSNSGRNRPARHRPARHRPAPPARPPLARLSTHWPARHRPAPPSVRLVIGQSWAAPASPSARPAIGPPSGPIAPSRGEAGSSRHARPSTPLAAPNPRAAAASAAAETTSRCDPRAEPARPHRG
jgi:hypothetical protein